MGKYTLKNFLDIKASYTPSFSPVNDEVAFLDNSTGTTQLYLINTDGSNMRQITDYPNRLMFARFLPKKNQIIFGMDSDGNEHTQFHLYDVEQGSFRELTNSPDVLHMFGGISEDGQNLVYGSNALDGTNFDIHLMNLETGDSKCLMSAKGWLSSSGFSPDGKYVSIHRSPSTISNDLYLIDVESGLEILVGGCDGDVCYGAPQWLSDCSGFYFTSNKDSNYNCLDFYDMTTGKISRVIELDWDIWGVQLSRDDSVLSISVNEHGYDVFKVYKTSDMSPLPLDGLPEGMITNARWSDDGNKLLFSYSDATRTPSVWMWDRDQKKSWQVTPEYQDIAPEAMVLPELAHYKSFDGLEVPVFLFKPKDHGDEPLPVVVMIHGGPEGQFQPYFNPVTQYLVSNGYAVAGPNVRGSTGYGRDYTMMDDKEKRLDSVRDIVSFRDYLEQRPEFDERKVVLTGGSYGGYMVLANLAFYPKYWAGGVDIVGISNLVTFLENTSIWRRALREAEYGSLAQDREMLDSISPINKAADITAPLMIIHGANDPRVPLSEAEQMHDTLKKLGRDVELLVYHDEGHGLAKRENRIDAWTKVVEFLDKRLKEGEEK